MNDMSTMTSGELTAEHAGEPSAEMQTSAVAGVPAKHEKAPAEMGSVLAISDTMVVLTWVAFLIALVALYKIAWKPILQALERREGLIRKSLEDAEKLRQATAESDLERKQLFREASQEAAAIVEKAREAAAETARIIEQRSREQATVMLKEAELEINSARERAVQELRQEASALAIDLAGRLIRKNLDTPTSRELTTHMIKELP